MDADDSARRDGRRRFISIGWSPPQPQAVMEAGDEASPGLTEAIAHRVAAMPEGQVLQIVSRAPTAQIDVTAWCRVSGHELLGLVTDDDTTQFWIRKVG